MKYTALRNLKFPKLSTTENTTQLLKLGKHVGNKCSDEKYVYFFRPGFHRGDEKYQLSHDFPKTIIAKLLGLPI